LKVNYGYIKVGLLLVLVGVLYAFANAKNAHRVVSDASVTFLGSDNLFVTYDNVSKLLIQNPSVGSNRYKEIIDLNALEFALNANPMVKKAEVFMSINGRLFVEVEQKRPIARVHTNASYYVDGDGFFMPLSTNYSARVPLVTGLVYKNQLQRVHKIAKAIDEDAFLKQHVIEIHQNEKQEIALKMRAYDFEVQFGDLSQIQKKINNFKAFYQKAIENKTINTYSSVNLGFDSQVICTKK
jgi:cell division protein FtsQ